MGKLLLLLEKELSEVFSDLWFKGYRLDINDFEMKVKISSNPEKYEVTTLKGLQQLAEAGKLCFSDTLLDEEDVEYLISFIKFCKMWHKVDYSE